jgi:hypothetical protein
MEQDHDARVINFATLKNLFLKSKVFTHRNIHKHTQTSPNRKTHNKNDHILTDRIWSSRVLNVPSFKRTDCSTNHSVVVANVRETLLVSKECTEV